MGLGFFLALPLLALLVSLLVAQGNAICPKDFLCGNLGRMSFPFTNISWPDCGLCVMECQNRPYPHIKLDPSSDQVFEARNMTMNNSIKLGSLQLQRLLPEQSCSTFYYRIYLPNSSSVSFKISNTITLFRCTSLPYFTQEAVDKLLSQGYKRYTSCDGFQIFYRNPIYHPSQPEPSPPGCMAIQFPMRPRNNVSKESELFQLLSFEFDLEWKLNAGKSMSKAIIIAIAATSTSGIGLVLVILPFSCRRKFSYYNTMKFWKKKVEGQNVETFLKNYRSLATKRYSYSDVKKMTNSFKIKLGQGGYGSVYKGNLKDGRPVAVKVLKESKRNGEEFINEVASISRTSHVNIVTLLGFCFQGKKMALIYEFMANGSLEKFIYGEKSLVNHQLEWSKLYQIAVGIARGLEYLHRGCNTRILHFDIKPHNILLDEDFCPKISDFGLAKICARKESMISTMSARGTIGYIAPEFVCKNIGGVSHKSDVYSYGMMVLEMVGGRKNLDLVVDRSSEIYFPHWIYTRLDRGEELGLAGILKEEDNKQARKMLMVSLWCIQTNPSNRPSMTNVVEMFEGNLDALQIPPRPYFSSPPRASSDGSTTYTTSLIF